MEGHRVYMSNAEAVKQLERIAGELRARGEPAEASPYGPEWKCPLFGNLFSLIDGTRTCTHNPECPCPEMPEPLRVFRAVRDARWAAEKAGKPDFIGIKDVNVSVLRRRIEVLEQALRNAQTQFGWIFSKTARDLPHVAAEARRESASIVSLLIREDA